MTNQRDVEQFIERWKQSGAAERANYALFLTQLCDVLGVPQPDPATPDPTKNSYVFERDVTFQSGDGSTSPGRIDLYKRGCFILEAKQGSDQDRAAEDEERLLPSEKKRTAKKGTAVRGTKAWDDAMVRARGQAEAYAKALPTSEGWPPFLVVVDVGHVIELYSEFTCSGKAYVMFPDPQSFRIKLDDLRDENIRQRLATVWTSPQSLDPSRRSAKVTRELAQRLAELAKLLEKAGHDPALVARFLMRCLFTMFAEDVELIPRGSFKDLLESMREEPENFKPMVEALWDTMNSGGFSPILRKKVLRFNGGLFAENQALPLDKPMLALLIESAKADWADVEPAIFGTLLERALDPRERHKLGAHFTPRSYVERLVLPTVIEPLREEWKTAYAAAITHANRGRLDDARKEVRQFHEMLCSIRILDPACGSGNFLYVTLEHMKRLEGEVLHALREFGEQQTLLSTHEVDPHQFLGIEINPRAATIADLVLWIGYLQWHFRTRGKSAPAEPIIRNFRNIECRDAVLSWDAIEQVIDEHGKPETRWDGITTKKHAVTGEFVPDENSRVAKFRYVNPRKAVWPAAEFIIGNPPYLGARTIRLAIGDEYLNALRTCYQGIPENCDYVMYWWCIAATATMENNCREFGLITTKSICQEFSRKVVSQFVRPGGLSFCFAIPNHPWIDSADGADVRVALTSCVAGDVVGRLLEVTRESPAENGEVSVEMTESRGRIEPNLVIGTTTHSCQPLKSNDRLCCVGYQLTGKGFTLSKSTLLEHNWHMREYADVVRPLLSARDIAQNSRELYAIDLYGLGLDEVRLRFPDIFQWIYERVKPERDANNRQSVREHWWLYGECRATFRPALNGLRRLIVTPLTAKHRYFCFADATTICDSTTVMFALDEASWLAVLSSRVHLAWFNQASGRLGVGNDKRYLKRQCFDPFPFPVLNKLFRNRLCELGEQLDAHRRRQKKLHPTLSLTEMYNVLEKSRANEALSEKEQKTYEKGMVGVLSSLHDEVDEAVVAAYGWPPGVTDDEILERLFALSVKRTFDEARDIIHWIRPEFQIGNAVAAKQASLAILEDGEEKPDIPASSKSLTKENAIKPSWPKERSQRSRAVQDALVLSPGPVTPKELAKHFLRGNAEQIEEILEALCSLGLARKHRGRFTR